MRTSLLLLAVCCCFSSMAQYKYDNVLYKTVFIEDLCAQLKSMPNAVLLDVRSQGEYDDTSQYYSLNIGRIKNTIHLNIDDMATHWRELEAYKNKPLYVMCSHSQRSRRVSKMLADSGFTNIINVNGGLTTFNLVNSNSIPCKTSIYETHNQYKLVSPLDLCDFIAANKNIFIADVRVDSVFRGIATDEKLNAYGNMNGAVNIPLSVLKTSVDAVPKGRKILLVDNFGGEAAQAAGILASKGYTDVYVLFNGLDMLEGSTANCSNKFITRTAKYKILPPDDFDEMMHKTTPVLLDVRPSDEFNNQSKLSYRNAGHIRNAVNIPVAEINQKAASLADKSKPIIVHHFSGGSSDPYMVAKKLTDMGYQNVYVLSGGVFGLRWRAANIKGKSQLKDYVVDIPADNL